MSWCPVRCPVRCERERGESKGQLLSVWLSCVGDWERAGLRRQMSLLGMVECPFGVVRWHPGLAGPWKPICVRMGAGEL